MQASPNRERTLKGFDDDVVVHRVADGVKLSLESKRQDEVRANWHPARTPKPKGQHAYRRGRVR